MSIISPENKKLKEGLTDLSRYYYVAVVVIFVAVYFYKAIGGGAVLLIIPALPIGVYAALARRRRLNSK